jgi:hypothetical protein
MKRRPDDLFPAMDDEAIPSVGYAFGEDPSNPNPFGPKANGDGINRGL